MQLIRLLGSVSYQEREEAMQSLIAKGPMAMQMLRDAEKDEDLEISRRSENCLLRIRQTGIAPDVCAAAARLLAVRKPGGAIEALFAYLPIAECVGITDEVRNALASLAGADAKHAAVLLKGLQDPLPLRRAVAAEVLCKSAAADHKDAVRKLLQDPDTRVRLRAAVGLANAKDAAAVPALIDLLPLLPLNQAWQAEDMLYRLSDGKNPPAVSLGNDEASRKKCRDAWQAWWQKEGKTVDLAKLNATQPLLGHTMIVLLDEGRVVDLGNDNQPRWSVDKLNFPLDAQVLPGDRVLVAEHHAQQVSERNTKGEILWKKTIAALMAQRLANGNTFIATDSQLVEFDRDDKEVVSITLDTGERIMKALKLANGEIACLVSDQLTNSRVIRLDSTGKELSSFNVQLGAKLFGGRIHMLPNGHVLMPHNAENKVVEYDAQGKSVWEVNVPQPIAAFRLPNGNTLVTSMQPTRGAVEFDLRPAPKCGPSAPPPVSPAPCAADIGPLGFLSKAQPHPGAWINGALRRAADVPC